MIERAGLYVRTVRHLKPEQIAHRTRLRAQKFLLNRWPDAFVSRWRRSVTDAPGWPESFVPLDARLTEAHPDAEANASGVFRFIEIERKLGQPPDWEQLGAPQLWRYHLHYFEWAWAFARHPDHAWARAEFAKLWRSWRESTRFGRWDAWSPYVVSLRAWSLCGVYDALVRGCAIEAEYVEELALHAGFVRANLELDVGGNHLLKNLKTLIGLGAFLRDEELVATGVRHLRRQIAIQVLDDGGHYERSPAYHCQVLGDLIDIRDLLRDSSHASVAGLDDAIETMRRWLGAMLMPDGDVPLFNDCWLVGGERLRLLEPAPRRDERLVVLEPSGYVVMRNERIHLVADVGTPCPDELPAHAHADCLSFELAVDGKRAIVDTGTSTYEPGPRRAYERSTRAHNTVEIDGESQTEVWGAFRAARRARPQLERAVESADLIEVRASHDGYERLEGSPRHTRTFVVAPEEVRIGDEVTGQGTHSIAARVHVADRDVLMVEIRGPAPTTVGSHTDTAAAGFNTVDEVDVVEATSRVELPASWETSIRAVATEADL